MLEQIIFFSLSFAAMSARSMNTEMQPLVKKTQHIYVCTVNNKKFQFLIHESTTALYVKQQLQAKAGVPLAQQSLYPLFTTWHNLWIFDQRGPKLHDSQKMQEIIGKYSDTLLLLTASSAKHS